MISKIGKRRAFRNKERELRSLLKKFCLSNPEFKVEEKEVELDDERSMFMVRLYKNNELLCNFQKAGHKDYTRFANSLFDVVLFVMNLNK